MRSNPGRIVEHYNGRSWDNQDGDLKVWDENEKAVAEYRDFAWVYVACIYEGDV